MPTDPLTGSRYPQSSDAPNVSLHIQNAVTDLAEHAIPNFTTTTTRNTAYTSWVAAGGVMRDGLFCVVGAILYEYQSGAWVVATPKAMRAQRTVSAPLVNDTWTAFATNTNWTETDPFSLRGSGAQVTAVYTGVYQINATVRFTNNATGRRAIRLAPAAGVDIGSGSGTAMDLAESPPVAGGFSTTLNGAHLTPLTAGNSVTLEALQTSGGSLDILFVSLSAAYLGPN